ncbi:MAG: hypothetical protein ACPHLK_09740 [Gammaproteobacteria bacterium]|jgi:hypothetical protein
MYRFLLQIVLLAFMVGSFPANAYMCHVDIEQLPDNTQQHDSSDCHEIVLDKSNDFDNSEDKDCCDSDCSACAHSNVYVMNVSYQSINYSEFKISYYLSNPNNHFPDISTPPPNV